ncbi:S1C family serine protease [Chitinimonas sp.]|uniref:S1C family serine protease n=1 Tax=Chitinimonas sp. TaxID=1934313 RepID=UPI002F950FE1
MALLCLVVLSLFALTSWSLRAAESERVEAKPRAVTPRGELAADERNNIDVFKLASASVVHITTLQREGGFFSLDVREVPSGSGTGFVWDKDGDIVTNYHVIRDGEAARVTLADQSTYKAILVGAFPDRDLAVLRIKAPAEKLRPIVLGRSADLQVGQKVYAIGNPFGLDQTLTTGIVSALGREIESVTRRPIRGVIQTDAAINPGNSGGPLLDSSGRLIGVNTMIYSPSGASAGIGFAIPVDEVNRVVPRLIRDGGYLRPSLGISAAPPEFNRALGLPPGVAVIGAVRGGPANKAGVRPFMRDGLGNIVLGDVIVAVNGKTIGSYDQLLEVLESFKVGEAVNLRVWRNRSFVLLSATLKEEM